MNTVTTADAQADGEERVAIAARDHQRQAEEEQRRVEKRLHESRVDGDADVGAQVGARAVQLVNQLAASRQSRATSSRPTRNSNDTPLTTNT